MSEGKVVSREARKKCWDARDEYWKCLDKNNDDYSKCENERKPFESNCTKTWVKHFERQRNLRKYKEKLESGYDPLAESEES